MISYILKLSSDKTEEKQLKLQDTGILECTMTYEIGHPKLITHVLLITSSSHENGRTVHFLFLICYLK